MTRSRRAADDASCTVCIQLFEPAGLGKRTNRTDAARSRRVEFARPLVIGIGDIPVGAIVRYRLTEDSGHIAIIQTGLEQLIGHRHDAAGAVHVLDEYLMSRRRNLAQTRGFAADPVEIVDRNALSPVYSFLTDEDQIHIITKVHSKRITSVVLTDAVKECLARDENVEWYSVRCDNFSMLHSYSTLVGIEKNMCIPSSCYNFDEL